jgi:hypothetical protein
VLRDTSGNVCTTSNDDLLDEIISINAYPNPAQDILNIDIEIDQAKNLQFTVLNTQGQSILNFQRNLATKDLVQFAITDLPDGLYILNIQSESASHNLRFNKISN